MREYIDARKNCEDIAMQMLVSSVVSEKNKREEDGSLKKKKGRHRVSGRYLPVGCITLPVK